jgi:hypothetical protein
MFVDNVFDSQLNSLTPVLYTSYVCHAAFSRADIPSESNQGLHHVAYRHDGQGGLIEQNTVGAGFGVRANPFKCNQNQEGSWAVGLASWGPSIKDERMVFRTFVDQKTRDVDLSSRTSIVVGNRFKGWACEGQAGPGVGGGGDFHNQIYSVFAGSGNSSGGNLPAQPTAGGGAHHLDFIGTPKKGVRHRAAPHERLGGGARHHTLDGNNNRIADIVFRGSRPTDEDGIIEISYSIVPSVANPSGSTVAVRWFYDEYGHAPENLCTLVATSHGLPSGSNLVGDVPVIPDQIYTVNWDAKGDGVIRGRRLHINGMIILADVPFGPILSPSGIAGLVSWFEADDESTISSGVGGPISQWRDKGGVSGIATSGVFQASGAFQPTFVPSANNGLGGVRFTSLNSEFLFNPSGSPIISNDASTICAIYEPASVISTDTIFSLSEDTPASGTTSREYMNLSAVSGGTSDISLEAQDFSREVAGTGPRVMILSSGAQASKARLLMWTEIAFESTSEVHPSGDTAITDIVASGLVESSGLLNMTFGRFSGAQVSGVYNGAGQYYNGTIYEIAVYDRNLSDTELDRFRQYAESKYNLTV